MHVLGIQTKINVSKMESVQRNSTEMEGQNSTEQRHLAVLAHAIHQEAEHTGVPVRFSAGREHARQARGSGT